MCPRGGHAHLGLRNTNLRAYLPARWRGDLPPWGTPAPVKSVYQHLQLSVAWGSHQCCYLVLEVAQVILIPSLGENLPYVIQLFQGNFWLKAYDLVFSTPPQCSYEKEARTGKQAPVSRRVVMRPRGEGEREMHPSRPAYVSGNGEAFARQEAEEARWQVSENRYSCVFKTWETAVQPCAPPRVRRDGKRCASRQNKSRRRGPPLRLRGHENPDHKSVPD